MAWKWRWIEKLGNSYAFLGQGGLMRLRVQNRQAGGFEISWNNNVLKQRYKTSEEAKVAIVAVARIELQNVLEEIDNPE